MPRIVILENLEKQEATLKEVNDFIELLNGEIEKFRERTVAGFSFAIDEIETFISASNTDKTLELLSKIQKRLTGILDKQLDKAKITASLIRNNLKKDSAKFLESFVGDMSRLRGEPGNRLFNKLSMIDGLFFCQKRMRKQFANPIGLLSRRRPVKFFGTYTKRLMKN